MHPTILRLRPRHGQRSRRGCASQKRMMVCTHASNMMSSTHTRTDTISRTPCRKLCSLCQSYAKKLCSMQKIGSDDGSGPHIPTPQQRVPRERVATATSKWTSATSTSATAAEQTDQVAERLQCIDALVQRYPGIITDRSVDQCSTRHNLPRGTY
jgi:hypothetical protein